MDPKAVDIRNCVCILIRDEEDIGLVVTHKVKASMKTTIYDVKVELTKNKVLSCACNCKAGSFGLERVMCVHILPILFQFCQLLHMALSEHILIEMTSFFTDTRNMNNVEQEQLLEMIKVIEKSDQGVYPNDDSTIDTLLHQYSVGTQRSKSRLLTAPFSHTVVSTVTEYCPL
jgi:hypothetical protein